MNLEELWTEMESAATPPGEGRLLRRIHPESHADLQVALLKPADDRMVLLTVPSTECPADDDLPSTRGARSSIGAPQHDGRVALELRLTDPGAREIFGALAGDVTEAASRAATDKGAVDAWITRLRRWQRLLARLPNEGLGAEAQLGLYAELWTLREVLAPQVGIPEAVDAWTGPEPALHDFQHERAAVEVKSTASAQHQKLQISSERQLDDTGASALYVVHLSLDARQGGGETLPDIVGSLRQAARGTLAEAGLEDRLELAGYLDMHATRYRTGYTPRRTSVYQVRAGFPRIVEQDLMDGVGDVRYSVAVTECRDFECPLQELLDRLGERDE